MYLSLRSQNRLDDLKKALLDVYLHTHTSRQANLNGILQLFSTQQIVFDAKVLRQSALILCAA